MEYDVAGLGNALVDALVRIPDDAVLEQLGLTRGLMHPVSHERWEELHAQVEDMGVEIHSGGSCANTIATLGLLGAKTTFCGQVGDDAYGSAYGAKLEEACGTHDLHVAAEGNTGKCLSLISTDAERTLCTDLGAAVDLPRIGRFAGVIAESRILHVTGYLFLGGRMAESAWEALRVAQALRIPVSLDVADPFVVDTVRDAMWTAVKDFSDIVFLNADEARALTGQSPEDAIHTVSEVCETVIVKLGARGSLVKHKGTMTHVQAHMTDAVDTTGAGDSYAAGYLYGLVHGWDPARCGDLGSRVAALTVGQVGAVVRDRWTLARAVEEAS